MKTYVPKGMKPVAGQLGLFTEEATGGPVKYHQPIGGVHGHACPQCAGKGMVRVVGWPAYQQVSCPRCGGSGLLKPSR